MSHSMQNAKVFMGAYNLTGYSNNVALQYGAEQLDETTLGDSTRTHTGGLKIVSAGVDGFWDATPDPGLQASVGVADKAFTVVAPTATAGPVAYFFKSVNSKYDLGGSVGELLNFGAEAQATNDLIRGREVYHSTASGSGTGTAFEFPAVATSGYLHGALHVFSASTGDTIDVIVQSDTATGMATPVTQLTFSQVGASATSQWQTTTGAITDTFYRISYTVAGSSPSYNFAVVLGTT